MVILHFGIYTLYINITKNKKNTNGTNSMILAYKH